MIDRVDNYISGCCWNISKNILTAEYILGVAIEIISRCYLSDLRYVRYMDRQKDLSSPEI